MASAYNTGDSTPIRQPNRECPICLKTFRTPKILRCGHSVCSACIDVLKATSIDIVCPVCRVRTNSIMPGALPTNFALQSLIDDSQDQTKKYPCQQCKKRHILDDMWTCKKCSLTLVCANCIVKAHRDHDVEAIGELLEKRQIQFGEWRQQLETVHKEFADRQTTLRNELGRINRVGRDLFSDFESKVVPLLGNGIRTANTAGNTLVHGARNADLASLTASGGYDAYMRDTPLEFQKLTKEQESTNADICRLHDIIFNAGAVMKELLSRLERKANRSGAILTVRADDEHRRNEASGGTDSDVPPDDDPYSRWEFELGDVLDDGEVDWPAIYAMVPPPPEVEDRHHLEEGATADASHAFNAVRSESGDEMDGLEEEYLEEINRNQQLEDLRRLMANSLPLGHGTGSANPVAAAQQRTYTAVGGIGRGIPVAETVHPPMFGHVGQGRSTGVGRGTRPVTMVESRPIRGGRGGGTGRGYPPRDTDN